MHNFNFPRETNTKAPKKVCINNSIPRKAAPHSVKQRPRGLFCVFISFHPGHARPASKRPKTNKCSFECARPSVSSGCLLSFPANPHCFTCVCVSSSYWPGVCWIQWVRPAPPPRPPPREINFIRRKSKTVHQLIFSSPSNWVERQLCYGDEVPTGRAFEVLPNW